MEVRNSNLAFGTSLSKHNLALSNEAKEQLLIASKFVKKNPAPGHLSIHGTNKDSLQLAYNENGAIKYGFIDSGKITYKKIVNVFKNLVSKTEK